LGKLFTRRVSGDNQYWRLRSWRLDGNGSRRTHWLHPGTY